MLFIQLHIFCNCVGRKERKRRGVTREVSVRLRKEGIMRKAVCEKRVKDQKSKMVIQRKEAHLFGK